MSEVVSWFRWSWRQLTSMRVAIFLLLALALAAMPGSLVPQRAQNPEKVAEFLETYPRLGPVLDTLGFFNVYSSVWFSAIYLLLFISLIGCILPRTRELYRSLTSPPVRIPSRLSRFESYRRIEVSESDDVIAGLAKRLKGRYRVKRFDDGLSAERGHLKEIGNLLFHYALVGILVSFAWGQLATYRGQAIVIEGRGFANALVDYDSFESGAWFSESDLRPFSFTLDAFASSFAPSGRPESFRADVTVREPDASGAMAERREVITPNHPIEAGDTAITLSGNGFAPIIRVTDAEGKVAFDGPVPFIPQDAAYTSRGVIKVPDVSKGLDQIGFSGIFMPAAGQSDGTWASAHPSLIQPLLVLDVWHGNLGLDEGIPRNAYELHTDELTQVSDDTGTPYAIQLAPGQTAEIPGGLGTIEFRDLTRFGSFDVRHDPSLMWLLISTVSAIGGLCISLFVPRRRLWVRTSTLAGTTVIEAAALSRGDDAGLDGELDWLLAELPAPDPRHEEN
ncbi:cytochrome c biogenesis protein [Bowdeniella nasicola]|uniref:Cytochrome c biogenesis protein n=1 Tax=Bowdeniella nasicola TaxID=208480 RepID=A0A1H3XB04_9ACTO|nr:cytochrome c biogenesis protein ResB [Bowdeniella nasicola]SDZ95802.1 cytochrome c biogenesis protein [Bowdeniella nasicola]